MHSSRMRTARLLPVSPSMRCSRGCTCREGGCTCLGVYLPRGVPVQALPPVNRMTDRCKNITLPQTSFAGSNKNAFQWNAYHLLVDHIQGVCPGVSALGKCLPGEVSAQGVCLPGGCGRHHPVDRQTNVTNPMTYPMESSLNGMEIQ